MTILTSTAWTVKVHFDPTILPRFHWTPPSPVKRESKKLPLVARVIQASHEHQRSTQSQLAKHLVSVINGFGPAVHDRGELRVYDSSAPGWVLLEDDELRRAVMALETHRKWIPKEEEGCPIGISAADVSGISKLVKTLLARPGFFNDAKLGAAFSNCFVRVEDSRVVREPHGPAHRVLAEHVLPFDLLTFEEAKQGMPRFGNFVSECWAGCTDIKERLDFLGEYLGAAMLRQTWRHKDNPLLVGEGDTGKSVMLKLFSSLFPPETAQAVSLQTMGTRFGLSSLLTASVNLVTELPASAVHAGEVAKALLVGDAVSVEVKFKTPFPYRCTIGHLFAANEIPQVPDAALRGRMAILHFPNVVPPERQDAQLPEKLAKEAQAIASWCIHKAARGVMTRGRFVRPPSSHQHAKSWTLESNRVAAWADESIEACDRSFVPVSRLYEAFRSWCKTQGEAELPKATFSKQFKGLGFTKRNRGSSGGRGYAVRFRRTGQGDVESS